MISALSAVRRPPAICALVMIDVNVVQGTEPLPPPRMNLPFSSPALAVTPQKIKRQTISVFLHHTPAQRRSPLATALERQQLATVRYSPSPYFHSLMAYSA